jgi:hypothetical protein
VELEIFVFQHRMKAILVELESLFNGLQIVFDENVAILTFTKSKLFVNRNIKICF